MSSVWEINGAGVWELRATGHHARVPDLSEPDECFAFLGAVSLADLRNGGWKSPPYKDRNSPGPAYSGTPTPIRWHSSLLSPLVFALNLGSRRDRQADW